MAIAKLFVFHANAVNGDTNCFFIWKDPMECLMNNYAVCLTNSAKNELWQIG